MTLAEAKERYIGLHVKLGGYPESVFVIKDMATMASGNINMEVYCKETFLFEYPYLDNRFNGPYYQHEFIKIKKKIG